MRAIASRCLGDAGQLLDDAEVGLRLGQDPRPLDLDRDERPVVQSRAWWTCAVDAAAKGTGSKVCVQHLRRRPSSLVTIATTSS